MPLSTSLTMPRSRSRVVTTAGLAIALLALAGCSTAQDSGTPDADAATTTVEDYFGEVEVPTEPLRVVAADPISLSLMLSLDVQPVAASFNPLALPAHLGDSSGIENIASEGGGFAPDIEKILAQDPDLVIVVAGYDDEGDEAWNKETYDRIAASGIPTYGFAYNDGVSIEDVSSGVASVAEVLGMTDEGDALLSALDDRMTALHERVDAAGLDTLPVSAVRLSDGGAYSIRVGTGESIAFRGIGLAQPEGQQDPSAFRIDFTEENLNILNASDSLFVYTDDGAEAEKEAITSTPLWPTLSAVQNDRVHWVDASVWNSSDPVALDMILDDIEETFIKPAEQQ